MKIFKILLVDDHAIVRAGIKCLIDQIEGFFVTAEASSIDEAMSKVTDSAPDIVITDIDMGNANGLDFVRILRKQNPQTIVMILSMHLSEKLVAEALKLGASAYLLKDCAPEELQFALSAVIRGGSFLSPAVSTKIISLYLQPSISVAKPLSSLTSRQIQILTMIGSGKSTKEIAYDLDLSDKTVAGHRSQVMERIGIHDLAGLVKFAIKHNLVKV